MGIDSTVPLSTKRSINDDKPTVKKKIRFYSDTLLNSMYIN